MPRRGGLNLSSVRGLVATGLIAGGLLAVSLVGVSMARRFRTAPLLPEQEPAADGPAVAAPELLRRDLLFPVPGAAASTVADSFHDPRSGGRTHQALDILAPRGSLVVAVEDGRILRLLRSGAGGLTVYQLDPSERYTYYYAHLDSYAGGLADGQPVRRGQTIGYVGTTGNAPPSAPHLHFAIFERTDPARWWTGRPVNPHPIWR